jgi:hypothetical protein
MKKVLLFLMVAFTSLNAFADANYLVNAEKNKVMVIDLRKTSGKEVNVTIVDANGETIFAEILSSNASFRKYNLSELATGTFTVVVDDKNTVSFQKIYISNYELLVDANIETITKPTVTKRQNKWVVNNTNNVDGTLLLADSNGEIIYKGAIAAHKLLSLNNVKLAAGNYTLTYTVNNKTFNYTLNK